MEVMYVDTAFGRVMPLAVEIDTNPKRRRERYSGPSPAIWVRMDFANINREHLLPLPARWPRG
jgi:hypothetical protein